MKQRDIYNKREIMTAIVISIVLLSVLVLLSAWRLNRVERKNEEFDEFLDEICDVINSLIEEKENV